VDQDNSDKLENLLDELEKRGLKNKRGVGIYVAMVDDIGGVCANVRGNIYGDTRKFAELEVEFGKTLIEKGFYLTWKPVPRASCCIADLYKGICNRPEGRYLQMLDRDRESVIIRREDHGKWKTGT